MPGARGFRGRQDAWRLIVATDQRLLVTRSTRPSKPFVVVDAPYRDVGRFGIEWKRRGYVGVLSLTAPSADGISPETHVIGNITPANLLSIARALQAHGVPPDDPAALEEAERGWEEAQRAWAEGRRPGAAAAQRPHRPVRHEHAPVRSRAVAAPGSLGGDPLHGRDRRRFRRARGDRRPVRPLRLPVRDQVVARVCRAAQPAGHTLLLLHGSERRDRPDDPVEPGRARGPLGGIGAAPRAEWRWRPPPRLRAACAMRSAVWA